MLCERCRNYEAVFHFTDISNNVQTELHLCNKCTGDINFETRLQNDTLYFKTIFSLMKNDRLNELENSVICLNCGLTDVEFSLDQKPGCPSCYKYFKSIINSISTSKNKKNLSFSKRPQNYIEVMAFGDDISDQNKVTNVTLKPSDLEEELRSAIIEERYEDAAILRDIIKEVRPIE